MPEPGEDETVRVVALDRSFHVECYKCEVSHSTLSENIVCPFFRVSFIPYKYPSLKLFPLLMAFPLLLSRIAICCYRVKLKVEAVIPLTIIYCAKHAMQNAFKC